MSFRSFRLLVSNSSALKRLKCRQLPPRHLPLRAAKCLIVTVLAFLVFFSLKSICSVFGTHFNFIFSFQKLLCKILLETKILYIQKCTIHLVLAHAHN